MTCYYFIKVPSTVGQQEVLLTFTVFRVELNKDFVFIGAGPTADINAAGASVLSGTTLPAPIAINSDQVWIIFYADSSTNDIGWILTYVSGSPCNSNPCMNGGTCHNFYTFYSCECSPQWTGSNCNIAVNPCNSFPCINGGTCDWLISSNVYTCSCPPSWTGSYCEIANLCGENPCNNGGICSDFGTYYLCTCPYGFTGTHCESDVNPCYSLPCMYGGTCLNLITTYLCTCMDAFFGQNCEI
uniref:Fibropellin-3-like n=1 Tax=Saccoglossus kowalevskii TaxID=10224 RepID=A0ABM0MEN6_SACKO